MNNSITTIATLFILGFCFSAKAVTFEEAISHYSNKQYENAFKAFDELSQLGNPKAQMNLGVMHFRGEHTKKDNIAAWAWVSIAAQNLDDAQKTLKVVEKRLSPEQLQKAQELKLSLLTELKTVLAPKPIEGEYVGAKSKLIKAPNYPIKMAKRRDMSWVDVQFLIDKKGAPRYFTSLTNTHSAFISSAIEALRASKFEPAKLNGKPIESFGTYRMIYLLKGMELQAEQLQQDLNAQKNTAIQGSSNDKLAYAITLDGLGSVTRNFKGADKIEWDNATNWWQKAAQEGSVLAKYNLGTSRLEGRQCEVSTDAGLFWLESASNDGLSDAKLALGREYLSGLRLPLNIEKGFKLIDEAANSGHEHAKVLGAWLRLTYPDKTYRNVDIAANYLNGIDKNYVDPRSLREAETALLISKRDWKKAKKSLKSLKKINSKYKQDVTRQEKLKAAIENKSKELPIFEN